MGDATDGPSRGPRAECAWSRLTIEEIHCAFIRGTPWDFAQLGTRFFGSRFERRVVQDLIGHVQVSVAFTLIQRSTDPQVGMPGADA